MPTITYELVRTSQIPPSTLRANDIDPDETDVVLLKTITGSSVKIEPIPMPEGGIIGYVREGIFSGISEDSVKENINKLSY